MRNKSLFELIAILMLAVGLIVTPAIDFFEPAVAVAAKKKTAKKKTSKRKSTKQKSTKQKSSSKNQGTLYRCARCGVVFSRGIDPVWDFVNLQQECRYGGLHAWRRMK